MEIAELVKMGGNVWKKEGYHRVYFNETELLEFIGLKCSLYNTGNIASACLNGEKISNTQARKITVGLALGKFWFDVDSADFQSKRLNIPGYNLHKMIVDGIEMKISEVGGVV